MATNDFLTFAGDPAANVMTQAQYLAAGFTARVLGFSAGTALSVQLNKVWRQASLISHMIGQFTVDNSGLDMLDDGTPSGSTALEAHFTTAVKNAALAAIGTGYLPITGGTLTGPLSINAASALQINAPTAAYASFNMVRQAGQAAQIAAYTGAAARWTIQPGNIDPEQGSNTGSNFGINSFQDGGQYLDTPLSINRATGVVNFSHAPTVNGGQLPYVRLSGDVMTGTLGIGGQGHYFPGMGGNYNIHRTAFGWDNSFIIAAVDGVYIGQLASVAWTQALAGAYLPLSGGTVTGQLTVNSNNTNFTVNATSYLNGYVAFSGLSDFANFYGSGRYRYRQWQGSWYDYFDSGTGYRGWVCNTVTGMSLDGSGNFNAYGTAHIGGGRLISQNSSYAPSVAAWWTPGVCVGFWADGSGMWLGNMDGGGNPYAGSNHMLIDNGGYITMYGSATIGGGLQVNGGITAASLTFYINGSQAAIWGDGANGVWRLVGTYPNFYQIGVKGWGNPIGIWTAWHPDGGGVWNTDINGTTTQLGTVQATGFYNWSDGSLKRNVEPWTVGLDAVLRINPVSYQFTEQSKFTPDRKFFGVTAQDVERVLPDAVIRVSRYAEDDVLAVDSSTVFFACVNAIKEITARLVAAETKLQTMMEGGVHA